MALYEYVTQEQLAGFDKYKYSAVDTNPLSVYVMHPFWNSMVKVNFFSLSLSGFAHMVGTKSDNVHWLHVPGAELRHPLVV
uniref:Uncharacterized protein n=1 Tax=Astyanax mexicanus TaxID=7994 RepID=A0A8B9HW59_ASTMX